MLDREEIDRVIAGEKLESTKKSRTYLFQEMMAKKREEEKKAEEPPPDPGRPTPVPTQVVPETPVANKAEGEKA